MNGWYNNKNLYNYSEPPYQKKIKSPSDANAVTRLSITAINIKRSVQKLLT